MKSNIEWPERTACETAAAPDPEMKTPADVLGVANALRRNIRRLEKERAAAPALSNERMVITARIRELKGELRTVLQMMAGGSPEQIETRSAEMTVETAATEGRASAAEDVFINLIQRQIRELESKRNKVPDKYVETRGVLNNEINELRKELYRLRRTA